MYRRAHLTGKSIKAYAVEKDKKMFFWRSNDIQIHLLGTVKYAFMTPFSPLVGVIDAIFSLVKMLDSPIKTAKINAAKQDFVTFVEESKYIPVKSYSNNELVDFACRYEFATSILNRFQKAVKLGKDLEHISQIHFVNEPNAKKIAIAEIELKDNKLNEVHKVYINKYRELLKSGSYQKLNEKSQEASVKKFNKEWREFQQRLIDVSDSIEIGNLAFNPSLSS